MSSMVMRLLLKGCERAGSSGLRIDRPGDAVLIYPHA